MRPFKELLLFSFGWVTSLKQLHPWETLISPPLEPNVEKFGNCGVSERLSLLLRGEKKKPTNPSPCINSLMAYLLEIKNFFCLQHALAQQIASALPST